MVEVNQKRRLSRLSIAKLLPAIGCTEPVAVALCVAKASELLGVLPARIEVALSGNMLKNAMGWESPGRG